MIVCIYYKFKKENSALKYWVILCKSILITSNNNITNDNITNFG